MRALPLPRPARSSSFRWLSVVLPSLFVWAATTSLQFPSAASGFVVVPTSPNDRDCLFPQTARAGQSLNPRRKDNPTNDHCDHPVRQRQRHRQRRRHELSAERGSDSDSAGDSTKTLVVISPPGGVGEVAAVKAASMGGAVRWFVVQPPAGGSLDGGDNNDAATVQLSQETLDGISLAGGTIELAGADADSLLLQPDVQSSSALPAVSAWCEPAGAVLCTADGVDGTKAKKKDAGDEDDRRNVWEDAIKVAAREAAKKISGGLKLVVVPASDERLEDGADEGSGGLKGLVGNLLSGVGSGEDKVSVPVTLEDALGGGGVVTLRYGELFGLPESNPNFSPLLGGPRRVPELCSEYLERGVRVDLSVSVSGNRMMGRTTRSSRHAVGEAAALVAMRKVQVPPTGIDACVTSLPGTEPPSQEFWTKEFNRVSEQLSSAASDTGTDAAAPLLFSAEFGSVPDVSRLADWLASKWAPAVLRTYDIAAIRIGARPVYANRLGTDAIEIVWQELVDFESVVTGRMTVRVTDAGLFAYRGPGDAKRGFGSTSRKPLPGEDVLVRRLAEAASQAAEKGLATRPKPTAVAVAATSAPPSPTTPPGPAVVTSIRSSGTVEQPSPASSRESGPRQAGVRRSRKRARGRASGSGGSQSTATTSPSTEKSPPSSFE